MKTYRSFALFNAIILSLLITLSACTAPEVKFAQKAKAYGFKQSIVKSKQFKHVVFTKPPINNTHPLHIYLDGDGTPWINHRWKSSNPTPRNSLMLGLMHQDTSPALYLARPCYHGFSEAEACSEELWTSHRYSTTVVSAMAEAIKAIITTYNIQQLVLIGHSGGGTLAVLLSEYFSNIIGIITIAANLDTQAWAQHHNYTALSGSLNPIQQKPLAKNIFQLHLAGAEDTNIPSQLIQSFVKKQFSAQFLEIDNFNHHCCWEDIWPSILQRLTLYNK